MILAENGNSSHSSEANHFLLNLTPFISPFIKSLQERSPWLKGDSKQQRKHAEPHRRPL